MQRKEYKPWHPTEYDISHVSALQALERGDATPQQQKDALAYLVINVCATHQMSYFPNSDRDTAFAEGKRYVGNQILKLLQISLAELRKLESKKK